MENFKFKTGDNSKNLGSLEDSINILELILIGLFYFLVLPIISQSFFVMRLNKIYLFIALALLPLSLIIYITLSIIKLKLKSDEEHGKDAWLYLRLKRRVIIFAYSTGVLSFLIATIFLNDLNGENIATLILLDIFVLNTISFIFYLEKHRVYLNNTESDHKFDYSTSLIIIMGIFYILLLIFGSYEPNNSLMSGLNQTHNYVFHILAMLSGVLFILVPLVLFYRNEYNTIEDNARRDRSDKVIDYIHKTIGEIKDESLLPDRFQKNKGNKENDKNKIDLQGPKNSQIRKYLLYPLKLIYYLFNSVVLILLAAAFFYYELIYGQTLFFFAFLNASVSFFIYSLLSGLSKSRKNSDILENRKIMTASVIKRIFYDLIQVIVPILFIIMALTDDAFTENILLCSLVGVIFGVSFGRFYFSGAIPHISKNKLRKKLISRAFHLFWLNILIIGASFLATLIPYLINPTPDVLSISLVSSIISNKTAFLTNSNITLYVVAIILVILFIGELYSNDRLRGLNHNLKNVIIKTSDFLKKIKNRKTSIFGQRNDGLSIMNFDRRIIVYTLILLFLMPSLMLFMVNKAHFSVIIKLPKTMYTVDGKAVDYVDLKQRTGVILLYSPNVSDLKGHPHNERIRVGKSVRLGGYFYGLGSMNLSEAIDWIGHNLDVLSLGICSINASKSSFTPQNITQIRAINPDLRFYYMAFATTLYETKQPGVGLDGTWGNTHYPYVSWNSTMHNWTLKLNNGSEALGVRRKSVNDSAHLMDLGNMGWADYFSWIYEKRAKTFNATGVAIDEVMWHGYWDTSLGSSPGDLRDYKNLTQIQDSCYKWLKRIREKMSVEIITQAFWGEAQKYQNGIWGEIAFRSGGQYGDRVDDTEQVVWYEKMNWEEIVRNMMEQGARNRSYIWAAWYERDNEEAFEYALSTYLMGRPNDNVSVVFHPQPVFNGGYPNNLAGYSLSNVKEELEHHKNYFDLELGDALGDMYLKSGDGGYYWERDFENGVVLVNPFHASIPLFNN